VEYRYFCYLGLNAKFQTPTANLSANFMNIFGFSTHYRPQKTKGWHMLNFHFLEKIKVVYGSNCTKFSRTEQRSVIL
jgi:hypothetical protein